MSDAHLTPPALSGSGVGPTDPVRPRLRRRRVADGYRGGMADNIPRSTPRRRDSDGIPDQVTVEDTIVTPLDRRDAYRYFWVVNQVILVVSAVVAVCAVVYGLAAGDPDSWISGIGAAVISMLSIIGLLLARLGSDLKYAGRI